MFNVLQAAERNEWNDLHLPKHDIDCIMPGLLRIYAGLIVICDVFGFLKAYNEEMCD